MKRFIYAWGAVLVVVLGWGMPALAHETDQFTLPAGKKFLDIGPWFSQCHYYVLDAAVRETNKKIASALAIKNPAERERRLGYLHSPGMLADTVRAQYAPGLLDMGFFELPLKSAEAREKFPGRVLIYEPFGWIYTYSIFPIDPRRIPLLFPAGTVECYGVYFGTDKIGHFHDLGHYYFKSYLSYRAQGESEEQAIHDVVEEYSRGLISENALVGNWATGVYSNGDLFGNYMGFKFYRNLTESVKLKGVERPPLLVRDGEFWKLNSHVGPDSDFMAPFFSDQFNEALNPCVYEFDVRWGVEGRLKKIAPEILAFYTDANGRPHSKGWFDAKVRETWTYYGEDYGHSRGHDNLLTIGNTCFPPAAVQVRSAANRNK